MTKLFFILLLSGMFFPAPTPAKLKVIVKNIQIGKGTIVVGVYRNKENFLKKPLTSKTAAASGESLEFYIDLTEGEYAVTAYQDLNDNKELDKGMFGIPKEPVGLSNNFQPKFSAPSYSDCKFNVSQQTTITIVLK